MNAPAAGFRTPPMLSLVGVPNCGKTALFNRLTGSRQKVANYPGVTVANTGVRLLKAMNPSEKGGKVRVPVANCIVTYCPGSSARPGLSTIASTTAVRGP